MFTKKQILGIFAERKANKKKELRMKIIKDLNSSFDNSIETVEFLKEIISFYNNKEQILW